jgi:apolipoprotein N-acyltransferase
MTPLTWKKSLFWLVLAMVCFNLAYASVYLPVTGLLIFGYALALVRLTNQSSVRRAYYWGLVTAYVCYAPQLSFMWKIFGPCALVLWLILAFWVGLFTALICGAARRWGWAVAVWLIPVVWTGLEYFRSELYYLKFSWLNIGYVLPNIILTPFLVFGMYGSGFLVFAIIALLSGWRQFKRSQLEYAVIAVCSLVVMTWFFKFMAMTRYERPTPSLSITGIQWEFPNEYTVAKSLDKALKQHPETQIFVLSEYTLEGTVPEKLKIWCRDHGRYLVIGGREAVTNGNSAAIKDVGDGKALATAKSPDEPYYNTAFVVGTNGEIVFKQAKSVPIQFFKDGLPAPQQRVWESPWGKIGICICYDLSYTRVTDELIRQGAQLLIVPTMDVEEWGLHQHELHYRVAPVRAAEYRVPIFRLASSGISQVVRSDGEVVAQTSFPGGGSILTANMRLSPRTSRPVDRFVAPLCVTTTGLIVVALLWLTWRDRRGAKGKTIGK